MSFSTHRAIPPLPNRQAVESDTFQPPPIDGSFTLQQMYDWHLQHSPNHRLFVYSREDGSIRTICWSEAVTAIYTGARLIKNLVPFNSDKLPVIAILTMSGARFQDSAHIGYTYGSCQILSLILLQRCTFYAPTTWSSPSPRGTRRRRSHIFCTKWAYSMSLLAETCPCKLLPVMHSRF